MEHAVGSWTAQDVAAWLRDAVGLPQYAEVFTANGITGALLLAISEDDMATELGVTSGIHRKRILLRIHKEAGREWTAGPGPPSAVAARTTSSAMASALWSTNSTSTLSPRVREALSSDSAQLQPGAPPGNGDLRVHTLSQSREEGILPDHLLQAAQWSDTADGMIGAAAPDAATTPAGMGGGEHAHAAPAVGEEAGGSRKGSISGFDLVEDGKVRIMSLAEQQAALEQARAQGAAWERKRIEEEGQKVAAEKAAAEAEDAERNARKELLKQKEEAERERARVAQEKRAAAEELAQQEVDRQRYHADALERDRHARLGLGDPPPSPAPRKSLSKTLSANMRESMTWTKREATRETILGSDAAMAETRKPPVTSSLPAPLAIHPSIRVSRSPWRTASSSVHTATGLTSSVARTGSKSYPWRSETATGKPDLVDPSIWDSSPRNVSSATSSTSSDEEVSDYCVVDRDKHDALPPTPTISPGGGVLARRKARLQQQRKVREETAGLNAVPVKADDVATGLQDSHEIWEGGREGIEIARVAREHKLDIPTARVVRRRLEEQERREKRSSELRTLPTNPEVTAGSVELSNASFANALATHATPGTDDHDHGHAELLSDLRKQTKDNANKFVLRTFQLDKTAGKCGQVQFWKAKAPEQVFCVECADISYVQKGFDGPLLERHHAGCEFQFMYEGGKVMRLRTETQAICEQWVSALRDIEIELMHDKRGTTRTSTLAEIGSSDGSSWPQTRGGKLPVGRWDRGDGTDSLVRMHSSDPAALDQKFVKYSSNPRDGLLNKSDLKMLLVGEFGFRNDDTTDGMADTLLGELGRYDIGSEVQIDRKAFDSVWQRVTALHRQQLQPSLSAVTVQGSMAEASQSPVSATSDFESVSSPVVFDHPTSSAEDKSALEAKLEKLKKQKEERRKARKTKHFRKSLKHKFRAAPFQLPPGWESAEASTGQTYYFNRETGEKRWDPPAVVNAPEERLESGHASGWFVVHTLDGQQTTVHWEGQPSLHDLEEQLKSELHIYSSFRLVTAGGDGVNLSVDTPAGSQFLLELGDPNVTRSSSSPQHNLNMSQTIASGDLDALGAEVDLAQGQAKAATSLDQKIEASKRLMHAVESLRCQQGSIDSTVAPEFGHRLGTADIEHYRLNEEILAEIDGMLGGAHKRHQAKSSDEKSLVDAYEQVLVYYLAVSESGLVPQEYMPVVHSKMNEAIGCIDLLRREVGQQLRPIADNEEQEFQQPSAAVGTKKTKVRPPLPRAALPKKRPPLPALADGETSRGHLTPSQDLAIKPDVYREQFDKYDKDRTGTLDAHEMVLLLHELNFDTSIDFAKKIMAQFDADRSGGISFDEFKQMWAILDPQDSDPAILGSGTAASGATHEVPMPPNQSTPQPIAREGVRTPATPLDSSRLPSAADPNNPTAGMNTLQKKAYEKLQAKKREALSPSASVIDGRTKRTPLAHSGEAASFDPTHAGDDFSVPRADKGASSNDAQALQGVAKQPQAELQPQSNADTPSKGRKERPPLPAVESDSESKPAVQLDPEPEPEPQVQPEPEPEPKPHAAALAPGARVTISLGKRKKGPIGFSLQAHEEHGNLLVSVIPNTPAAAVNAPVPSHIVEINSKPVRTEDDIKDALVLVGKKPVEVTFLGVTLSPATSNSDKDKDEATPPRTDTLVGSAAAPDKVSAATEPPEGMSKLQSLKWKKAQRVLQDVKEAKAAERARVKVELGSSAQSEVSGEAPATTTLTTTSVEPPEGMTKLEALKWKKAQNQNQQGKAGDDHSSNRSRHEESASVDADSDMTAAIKTSKTSTKAKASKKGKKPRPPLPDQDEPQAGGTGTKSTTADQSLDANQVTLADMPEGLTKLEEVKWKKANGLHTSAKTRPKKPADSIEGAAGANTDESRPKAAKSQKMKRGATAKPPAPAPDASGGLTLDDMPEGLSKLEQLKWQKANGLKGGTKTAKPMGSKTRDALPEPAPAHAAKPMAERAPEPAPAPGPTTAGGLTLADMPDGLTKMEQLKWKKANGLGQPNAGATKSKAAKRKKTKGGATARPPAPAPDASGGLTLDDMPEGLSKLEQLKWQKANGLKGGTKTAR